MWVLDQRCVGCGSRFWVSWAGVLGRSLVEFGLAFYSLFCWLVEFFFFFFFCFFFVEVFGFGICWRIR